VLKLEFNVDDMTGEEIGFAMDALFTAGAREVYTIPVGMKKSRTGTLFNVICDEAQKDTILTAIFRHTTTLGVREFPCETHRLERSVEVRETPLGKVRYKTARGYGVERGKYEYDDVAEIARKLGLSVREVLEKLNN